MKILYILKYLWENTDEEHPVTTKELIAYLAEVGISAERKSIYKDLEALENFGIDIYKNGGQNASYYLASRDLQLVEAKILVDAVCTSRFLTPRKTDEICKKLSKFVSKAQSSQLERNVHVMSRIKLKSENEQIYYNIDKIQRAIQESKNISFFYKRWVIDEHNGKVSYKEIRRNDGNRVHVFPIALLWDDEHYYLVAEDLSVHMQKHYRLDRMESIEIGKEGNEDSRRLATHFEPAKYSRRVFDMYSGNDKVITIGFKENLLTSILDRFGQDIIIEHQDEKWFRTKQVIKVSDRFFAWVAAFGGDAKILEPTSEIDNYKDFLRRAMEAYGEQ